MSSVGNLSAGKDGPVEGMPFSIELLGGFRMRASGRDIVLAAGAQRLIAFTVLNPGRSRRTIAGTLWPENVQQRADANMRTALWKIRSAAPQLIAVQHDIICLDSVGVDVVDMEAWAHEAVRGSNEEQGEVSGEDRWWRVGDLLPDWDDAWLDSHRDRLATLHLQALESAARRLIDNERHVAALPLVLDLVQRAPFRDSAHRLLVSIFLRQSNVAEAMAVYHRFRESLRSELGLEPSAELTALICDARNGLVHTRGRV